VPANVTPACDACRAEARCREAQACVADAACAAWLACEDACAVDDAVCQNECWSTLAADRPKAEYMACKQRACSGTCAAAECSADYNYFDAEEEACRACRNLHCCNESVVCWHDADCVQALECYNTCPDTACFSRCNDAAHRPLLMTLAEDWACRSRWCLEECASISSACSAFLGFSGDCATCVEDNCCAETRACSEDPECVEYDLCIADCAGRPATCRDLCRARYWVGGGLESVRAYCLASRCTTICGTTDRCGGLDYPSGTCRTCMIGSCCAEAEACGTDAGCAGLFLCLTACHGDAACAATCRRLGTADGVTLYDAVDGCRTTSCATECPAG
jgi:hypothetical protein